MKKIILLFILLAACVAAPTAEQAVSKPIVQAANEPREVAVPVLVPEVKSPPEQPKVNVTVAEPELPKEKSCKELCADECAQSAKAACAEKERSLCKANCGSIADPSACTQACAYLHQPSSCQSILQKACTSKCVEICH